MGACIDQLEIILNLVKNGDLTKNGLIIDIGCQQLWQKDPIRMQALFDNFNIKNKIKNPEKYFENGTFIGFILQAAGFRYNSFDIVEAPFCIYFNLNFDKVPDEFHQAADLVLNFGTTEHVLNQYNALQVIHDLTKLNGLIFSYFIRGQCMDHGLLHYSDRFVDLWIKSNDYQTIWRDDKNDCTWVVVKKINQNPFSDIVDVQEGEDLPKLRVSK